jgi:two-component system chemotaxis response regulator CheY
MPNLDGLATLKAIKSDPATADIPVMMVTSEGEREQLIQAIQSGATQYLTKPFTEDDLIAHIAECLPQDEY